MFTACDLFSNLSIVYLLTYTNSTLLRDEIEKIYDHDFMHCWSMASHLAFLQILNSPHHLGATIKLSTDAFSQKPSTLARTPMGASSWQLKELLCKKLRDDSGKWR